MNDTSTLDNFVLLANARLEKGFGLLVDLAQTLSDITFVAVDSQPEEGGLARKDIPSNLVVVERTNDMAALYLKARIVVAPSYRFVETFSRVCIEAQRFGVPVIGSDVGNVPYLLRDSGTVLPESLDAWIGAIRKHYDDEDFYRSAKLRAEKNAAKYTQGTQRAALVSLLSNVGQPLLIGIGSGIGNMLHAGPMIRNIARRLGHKVDLVVAEDHARSLFLLHDPQYVNAVYALRPQILNKQYARVFLTHSFGNARVKLNADEVIWSRDWDQFHPDHQHHETVFNLEAAKALLGVEYDEGDSKSHYVGTYSAAPRLSKLVGLHGGSKSGHWASKRWPHFDQLVPALKRAGYQVASFGTQDEYVPGTVDMTGGTIEHMTALMRECSFFISNDSGLMNIANALQIPVLAIFGPTNARTREPLSNRAISVSVGTDCSPCEVRDKKLFDSGGCACLQLLTVERVWGAFQDLVAANPIVPSTQGDFGSRVLEADQMFGSEPS